MIIHLHRDFTKQFQKLRPSEQKAFLKRRNLFVVDLFHPLLNNHALKGRWENWRSFNVTGDIRIIFREMGGEEYLFFKIGTHPELYG